MARLWSCGFELNSTDSGVEAGGGGLATIVTSPVRSGVYAAKVLFHAIFAEDFSFQFASSAANGPYFFRFYLYITTLPGALTTIAYVDDQTGSSGQMLGIKLDTSGVLQLFQNSGQIGSDSLVLNTGQWYRIEMKFDRTPSAGSQIGEASIGGNVFATANNLTYANGINQFVFGSNLKLNGVETTTIGELEFDDVAINDSTGAFQNSYPGEGSIIHLQPNAAGDHNDFTINVGGTVGASNNYTRVNEITPDDATSYNGDTISGDIDDFNATNTPSSIASTDKINVVQIGVRYQAIVAAGESPFVVRAKKTSGGTVSESSTITPNSTSWNTNANASPFNYPLTLYQDPNNSDWTKVTLDSAQIGYRITSLGTNATNISTVWMLVEYVSRIVFDSVTVSENITVVPTIGTYSVNTSDLVTIQEQVTTLSFTGININNTVSTNETITLLLLISIVVNDLATITENISRMKSIEEVMPSSSSGEHQGVRIWKP